MNNTLFSAAKAVFYPLTPEEENAVLASGVCHFGFYTELKTPENLTAPVVMRIAARSMYRLYVNGKIVAHGPARTAHGYCRVDTPDITAFLHFNGNVNHIAVEVMTYGPDYAGYNQYANDIPLESGLLTAEITVGDDVFCATGTERSDWRVCRLSARVPSAERISHCRACVEIYHLDDEYHLWRTGKGEEGDIPFVPAVCLPGEAVPQYLVRRAPMPTLDRTDYRDLLAYNTCRIDDTLPRGELFFEKNSPHYHALPEHPTADCRRTVSDPSRGIRAEKTDAGFCFSPVGGAGGDFCAMWDGGENRVGFVGLTVECERAGIIDLVRTELLTPDGEINYAHNTVIRLYVPKGETQFVSMEPGLARYVKLMFRGTGAVTVKELYLLDDAYPAQERHRTTFLCSDENVNRLYAAAERTLILNTLDIFMDCPDRERGGWLCDSLWTGRAASLLLSDDRVERDFLENFLLTPPEEMFRAFFPEVYPAHKSAEGYKNSPGITTWSFWLMCELCEYIRRTGDTVLRDSARARVTAFVCGAESFVGSSGLLEHLPGIFIDWSMSNRAENTSPISVAANALFAYMMENLGETFGVSEWLETGKTVRTILRRAILCGMDTADLSAIPDALGIREDGSLLGKGVTTEAATYTSLWCGLFTAKESPRLARTVRDAMGPAPIRPKDPMVGASQLFIGLCIRLDMLCRQEFFGKMYDDMLALYLPQLKEGPGTLWENESPDVTTTSRCHGFTAHAGVHLVRDILGLGIPMHAPDGTKTPVLEIAPHLSGLRYAKGTRETPHGTVSVAWNYDGDSFTLRVTSPRAYEIRTVLPREVRILDPDRVTVSIQQY